MKLLVGLGNPGKRYAATRHNAGWLWLDHHFDAGSYEFNKYGNYEFKHVSVAGINNKLSIESDRHPRILKNSDEPVTANVDFVLIKPQTFMNESGTAVAYAMRQFGVTESDLIVIHDEVDLEVGEFKFSCSRGDGGHNGIKSITKHLGNNEYCRLRLGVRPAEVPPTVKADTYVLNRFRDAELAKLSEIKISVLEVV